MKSDKEQIRQLVSTWLAATTAGDVDTVLSLMSDDVIFLVPGQPVMRKAGFAEAARSHAAQGLRFEGTSEIQEITVLGEWAFMWSKLTVIVAPPDGGKRSTRAGHTLSVLKKENGRWLLARDANLLVPVT